MSDTNNSSKSPREESLLDSPEVRKKCARIARIIEGAITSSFEKLSSEFSESKELDLVFDSAGFHFTVNKIGRTVTYSQYALRGVAFDLYLYLSQFSDDEAQLSALVKGGFSWWFLWILHCEVLTCGFNSLAFHFSKWRGGFIASSFSSVKKKTSDKKKLFLDSEKEFKKLYKEKSKTAVDPLNELLKSVEKADDIAGLAALAKLYSELYSKERLDDLKKAKKMVRNFNKKSRRSEGIEQEREKAAKEASDYLKSKGMTLPYDLLERLRDEKPSEIASELVMRLGIQNYEDSSREVRTRENELRKARNFLELMEAKSEIARLQSEIAKLKSGIAKTPEK
jgi:hypothetical protein